ncbi:diguanylate cyclase [Nostoc sp. MBR 210]|nr:diguanylate cyclase [Nostoc sp. MBR 210]
MQTQVQSILHHLPEQHSRFFSLSVDLLCIAGFDGYFKEINPAWTKILGWSAPELLGKPFIEFIYPDDQGHTLLEAKKLAMSCETVYFENRYLCRDGSYKWLAWSATPFVEEQLIYAVARDITLQKDNDLALQKTMQELEAFKFALNAHSLVAITDVTGRINYANDKFCEVSQYSREELLGQDHRIINSGYHSPEFFRNLWETITTGKIWRGEIKNKAKDNSFYWVDTLIVPMLNSNGKPQQYVAIRTDITQRKLSELALLERSRLSLLSAEVSLSLSQSGALAEILQSCINTISKYLDVHFVCIWTLEQQTQNLEFQAGVYCQNTKCHPLSSNQKFTNYSFVSNAIFNFISQNYQPILNESVRMSTPVNHLEQQSSTLQFSAYPLIVEQKLIGIMALFSQESFNETVHNMLNWIANNVAVAIDRIWAREELLSRREALLLGLASQIRNSLDLDKILETAVHEIRSLLQVERCYFLQYSPDFSQPHLTITHESRNDKLPSMLGNLSLVSHGSLVNILVNQELVCIDSSQQNLSSQSNLPALLNEDEKTAQLLLPVKSNVGSFGAIICSHCLGDRIWSNSDIGLLQAVTDQLAIAIDHAQLYTQSQAATLAAQAQAEKLTQALHQLQQTQSQLIQHEKMSSLGQLVAGVAHEINNPVNFIHGNINYANEYVTDLLNLLYLYRKCYPEPTPEIVELEAELDLEFLTNDLANLLNSMRMGTNRIREIVLNLRNFSRLDEADKKLVNIHDGIDNTLLILHHRCKNNGIGLGISILKEYANLPLVDCYPGQLNQVLMNILTNAIDALEESINQVKNSDEYDKKSLKPTIVVSTGNLDNNLIFIKISDNGSGMTEEVKRRLFDPFFTTKPIGKGTGLGLSISYQIIVEKHSGSLECVSEPGKGTEFLIKIPVKLH